MQDDLTPDTRDALIRVAHDLADAARPETLRHFRTGLSSDNKASGGRFDPVTEADRAAERAMRDVLARMRPQDAILGEEYGPQPGTSGLTWVLDPIDGTKNFVRGVPVWATLVALMDGDEAVVGLVSAPALNRRWWAAKDVGEALDVKALATFTQTGETARRLSALHPHQPLLAFTVDARVRSQLALSWGVETFLVPEVSHTDDMVAQVDFSLLSIGRLKVGDRVVVVAGSPPNTVGSTNLMRVHEVGTDS